MQIVDKHFHQMSAIQALRLFKLRSSIFVVEQDCVYQDLDGRDEEPNTRHIWRESADQVLACLRLLQEKDAQRIGRVATAASHRRQGHAAVLIEYTLSSSTGPWLLSGQCQLETWYTKFGFSRCGDDFMEDGIPHLPMRRG